MRVPIVVIGTVDASEAPIAQHSLNGNSSAAGTGDEMRKWMLPEVAARYRAAGWRSNAYDRYLDLADGVVHGRAEAVAERAAAADLLRAAAGAFEIRGASFWWSGVAETEVLGALDRAERHLVPLDQTNLVVFAEKLQARLARRFKSDDSREVAALKLLKQPDRSSVQGALDILHAGSLSLRSTQRARRNATVVSGVLTLLSVVALVLALSRNVGGLSLAMPASKPPLFPPIKPAPVAPAWAVAAFGAVGAVLSLVALRLRANGVARAGGGWTVQALFKIATGALTALLAAMFVQQLDVPVIKPQLAPKLLAWAIVFGYAQDIVTKKLDERVTTIEAPVESTNKAKAQKS